MSSNGRKGAAGDFDRSPSNGDELPLMRDEESQSVIAEGLGVEVHGQGLLVR